MKRLFFVIGLLGVLTGTVKAEVVTREAAGNVAETFLSAGTRGGSEVLELVWDGETDKTRGGATPAFYVFARKSGGFVVVSGESSIAPILAYSYNDKFQTEGMPENLETWFSELRENVNSRRGCVATPQVAQKWNTLSTKTRAGEETIPPVLIYNTAKWGQDYPFNLMCPIDHQYERLSKVGCTAVSFATILHYWKWPDAGVGKFESYWATDKHYVAPEIVLGYKYPWDLMLDDYYASEHTPQQDSAAALLCRDVAQGGKSIFGANGANGDQTNFVQRLSDPFKLTHKVRKYFRIHFTPEDWVKLIEEGLQYGPVYYGLAHNDGGHAIVADGYDANGFIHFNWGFYGMNDGFYDTSIDNLNGAMFYPKTHSCFIGLGPRGEDEVQEGTLYYGNSVACGVKVTSGTPVQGAEIVVSLNNIFSACPFDFQPQYVVAHCDRNFKIKSLVSEVAKTELMEKGAHISITGIACKITEPIEYGDALAMFYHTSDNDTAWTRTRYSVQSDAKIVNGVYALTDAKSVAQGASLSYSPSSRSYTLTCTANAECTFTKDDGSQTGGLSGSDGNYTIETKGLAAGRYKVKLSHKKYIDIKEFEIIIR